MHQPGTKSVASERPQVLTAGQKADLVEALRIAARRSANDADSANQVTGKFLKSPNLQGFQAGILDHYRLARDIFVHQATTISALADMIERAPSVTLGTFPAAAPTSMSDLGLGPVQTDHGLRHDEPAPPAAHNGTEGELLSEGDRPTGVRPRSTASHLNAPTQSEASAARLDRVA